MTPERLLEITNSLRLCAWDEKQASLVSELIEEIQLLNQKSALDCEKCGWAFRFPDEPCAHCERLDLRKEVDRLTNLMSAEPVLKSLWFTQEDGLEVQVEHWGVKLIAASVLDTLLNGREAAEANFLTMTMQSDIGPLEVTVRKTVGGKSTPADQIALLKQEIEMLKEEICRRARLETSGSI